MPALLLVGAFSAPALAQRDACDSLDSLRWLLGDWTAEGDERTFHESWVEAGPRTFEGTGIERATADGAVKSGEALRLVEMAEGVFYISKVSHNELPVAFRLSDCADGRFVFVNPKHDFPRRLEYLRGKDERVTVNVSDGAGTGFTLNFARASATSQATAPVLAAEDARFAAMVAADAKEMRRWLAADLEYVHSTGEVESREELIESIVGGRRRFVAVQPIERRAHLLGPSAATIQGQADFQAATDGKRFAFRIR
ncbi:MAG: DUF6265 family protein, partial [Steroidobacteraceae bacterium]